MTAWRDLVDGETPSIGDLRLLDTDNGNRIRYMRRVETDVYAEIRAERERAHKLHGATSNESSAWDSDRRLRVLVEEVGEVAHAFNDHEHGKITDRDLPGKVREELIQVAAMAASWADSVPIEKPWTEYGPPVEETFTTVVDGMVCILRVPTAEELGISPRDMLDTSSGPHVTRPDWTSLRVGPGDDSRRVYLAHDGSQWVWIVDHDPMGSGPASSMAEAFVRLGLHLGLDLGVPS